MPEHSWRSKAPKLGGPRKAVGAPRPQQEQTHQEKVQVQTLFRSMAGNRGCQSPATLLEGLAHLTSPRLHHNL